LLKELALSRSYWIQVLSRLFVKVFSTTYSCGTHNPTIVLLFGLSTIISTRNGTFQPKNECPRKESNFDNLLRRQVLYPLSYGGNFTTLLDCLCGRDVLLERS
jgi:hypothetical protein